MTALLLEPATDWTGQTYEERLILCAEALHVHGRLNARLYNQITSALRADANKARSHRAAFRRKEPQP